MQGTYNNQLPYGHYFLNLKGNFEKTRAHLTWKLVDQRMILLSVNIVQLYQPNPTWATPTLDFENVLAPKSILDSSYKLLIFFGI